MTTTILTPALVALALLAPLDAAHAGEVATPAAPESAALQVRHLLVDGKVLSTAVPVGDWSAAGRARRAARRAPTAGGTSGLAGPVLLDDPTPQLGTLDPEGIQNGSFSSGLDAWLASESGGSAAPGSVLEEGGRAVFREGDSFLVSLEQTFVLPAGVASIEFDLFVDPGFDTLDNFLPDAWEVSLLDDGGFPAVDPWDAFASSYFNLQEDGSANLGPSASWDGNRVGVDVSALQAGELYTLVLVQLGADGDTGSQLAVDDVALTVDCGVPGESSNYGNGWPGSNGVPTLSLSGVPAPCTDVVLEMGGSAGVPMPALVIWGLSPIDVTTIYGGSLLVDPMFTLDFELDASGRSVPLSIPCDALLCGEALYLQVITQDPGASAGWAFTPGLEILFGDE